MSQRWNTNDRSENPWAGDEKGLNSIPVLPIRNYATLGIHFTCRNLPFSDLWSEWVGQERLAVVLSSLRFLAFGRRVGEASESPHGGGPTWLRRIALQEVRNGEAEQMPGTHRVYLFFGYIYSCSPAPSCHFILRLKMFQTPKLKIGKWTDSNMWPVEVFLILRFPFFMTLEK